VRPNSPPAAQVPRASCPPPGGQPHADRPTRCRRDHAPPVDRAGRGADRADRGGPPAEAGLLQGAGRVLAGPRRLGRQITRPDGRSPTRPRIGRALGGPGQGRGRPLPPRGSSSPAAARSAWRLRSPPIAAPTQRDVRDGPMAARSRRFRRKDVTASEPRIRPQARPALPP
jgi:hypothetical protein